MNVLLISLQSNLNIIGLKYLHYCLLQKGHNAKLIFLPNFRKGDQAALAGIGEFIRGNDIDLTGISLMSHEFFNACELTGYLKRGFPQVPVVWGGIHPTITPEKCLDFTDYVCVGEGENCLMDLAAAIRDGGNIREVDNLCFMEEGAIRRNRLAPLIEDLDSLPLGEQVPRNSFLQKKNGEIVSLADNKETYSENARYNGTVYDIISSRGCPFSCTYCCNNSISLLYNSRKIRRRGIRNIIAELKTAVAENPEIESINFQDDCFLSCSNDYLREFCLLYRQEVKKPFIVRSIPIYINREKIRLLQDAGLSWLSLGLQSGSDRVCRDIYKRNSFRADFLSAAGKINDFKVAAFYDVILDNPFETEEDRLQTIETLMQTPKPFQVQFFSLVFYLGTELYEKMRESFPEKEDEYLIKNYNNYKNDYLNKMVRLAAFINKGFMRKILSLYKKDPKGINFKVVFLVAQLISALIFEPLAYLRVIKLSQRGSFRRTLRMLPSYFKVGFNYYLKQFSSEDNRKASSRKSMRSLL